MARIVGGSAIGELRGKLGNFVFSRNQAGPIVRQYVVPVNHRSNAQMLSRNLLSEASAVWCTLPDEIKEMWNNFAKDPVRYTPIYKMNHGGISGQNAFVGAYVAAQKVNAIGLGITTIPAGLTAVQHSLPYIEPPDEPVDGTISGQPLQIQTVIFAIDETNGQIKAEIELKTITGVTGPFTVIPPGDMLKDGHGNPVGFKVLFSTTKKDKPNFSKKMVREIGGTGLLRNDTTDPIDVPTIKFTVTRPVEEFFTTPVPGTEVDITIAMISKIGIQRKIIQATTTVITV